MIARPVPRFENGARLAMQRGAGFCTVKSTPEREAAAATFLKWLTEPENNVRFVTSVGYMPVTEAAFELLPDALAQLTNPTYRSLYEAFVQTQADYEFYTPPQFADYLTLEQTFEAAARSEMAAAREAGLTADEAFDALRRAVAGA